jgi:signal transduction histidine kinase
MNRPIHVLLVEDSPGDARLIQLMLSEARGLRFDLTWVDNLPDGLARLRAGRIDVVLLDLGLPGSTGLDTLLRLFDQGATHVPTLVVLSGLTDEEIAVQALQSGAQDYLVKGQVDSALLVRAIRYAIGRSQADEALRHAHAALQERTAELIAAKERAELANRAKSAFLAHMSHDLRTPLNGILGFAQLLQADPELGERQRTASTAIRQCGEHLLTLINDILDLAKIEAGKIDIVPADVDLRRFLQAVEDIIRVRVAQKPGLAFVCEFAPDLPAGLRVDERRLRQVALNLLDNAVKFSDLGSVHWRVAWRAPGRLRMEVQDTGVGMGEPQLRRLFQPFEQVSDPQRRSSGTGLGLVISRQFVRLMGGEIEVSSQPGQGSRFAFEIDAPAASVQAAPPAAQAVGGYQGPRRRVLVVDDRAEHRALLVGMMQPLGFEMVEAAGGAQGLALAQALRPDLLLLDLVMPDLGGIEVIRRLRSAPGLGALPIVTVSASAGPEDQRLALAAGANAFLPKPVDRADLLRQAGSLLALRWTDACGRCIEPGLSPALQR